MKSAKSSLWLNPGASANPKAPALNGYVELPASLVWELSQMLQQQQGMETNPSTGEPFFKLRVSMWNRDGANNGPVLGGEIESPAERAAYLASRQAAPAVNGNGQAPWMQQQPQAAGFAAPAPVAPPAPPAPPAPAAPQPQWQQPSQPVAPTPTQWNAAPPEAF